MSSIPVIQYSKQVDALLYTSVNANCLSTSDIDAIYNGNTYQGLICTLVGSSPLASDYPTLRSILSKVLRYTTAKKMVCRGFINGVLAGEVSTFLMKVPYIQFSRCMF